MKWTPIIEPHEKLYSSVVEVLNKISGSIQRRADIYDVTYGSFGDALFYGYRWKQTKNEDYLNIIGLKIEEGFDLISTDLPVSDFGKGLAGICWAFDHLVASDVIDSNVDAVLNDSYNFIKDESYSSLRSGNYDYLLGGAGALLFFLERNDRVFLNQCIDILEEISICKDNCFAWKQSPVISLESPPEFAINTGLAHGIPSIMALLSIVYVNNKDNVKILRLIEGTMNWLIDYKLDIINDKPFPSFFNSVVESNRMSWCYGDIGVSMALYQVGVNCKNDEWVKKSLRLALKCVERNKEASNVTDAHLCHGTIGIAHIYNRFYNYTQMEIFKDASLHWVNETIKKFDQELPYGFKAWKGEKFEWQNIPGLLEGSAGIGLALISVVSDVEPKWDRCLLLS